MIHAETPWLPRMAARATAIAITPQVAMRRTASDSTPARGLPRRSRNGTAGESSFSLSSVLPGGGVSSIARNVTREGRCRGPA